MTKRVNLEQLIRYNVLPESYLERCYSGTTVRIYRNDQGIPYYVDPLLETSQRLQENIYQILNGNKKHHKRPNRRTSPNRKTK